MTRAKTRYAVAVLLLILVAMPLTAAADPIHPSRQNRAESLALSFDGVLSSLLSHLVSLWEKEGSSVDPSGKPGGSSQTTSPQSSTGDEGSSVDPSGRP
jgi:hypothetical protein